MILVEEVERTHHTNLGVYGVMKMRAGMTVAKWEGAHLPGVAGLPGVRRCIKPATTRPGAGFDQCSDRSRQSVSPSAKSNSP